MIEQANESISPEDSGRFCVIEGGPAILVAEDDPLCRKMLRKILTVYLEENLSENVEIVEATSRKEALERICEMAARLVVVVTDMHMPDNGDGNVVAQAAIDEKIGVIIVTGSPKDVRDDIRDRCLGVFNKGDLSLQEIIDLVCKQFGVLELSIES